MFNNISWGSYCYALFIFVVIYYLVIVTVYYRRELQFYFLKFSKPDSSGTNMSSVQAEIDDFDQATSLKEIDQLPVRSVLDDLSVLIRKGAEKEYPKAELLQALKVKLNSCQNVLGNEHKAVINERILSECKKYCSMHLDVEELDVLWFD